MLDMDDAIAVVGLGVRLPGADDVEEFWLNLVRGQDTAVSPSDPAGPPDAELLGLTPRAARECDHAAAMFLQIAHQTIENAGYDAAALPPAADLVAARAGAGGGVTTVSYRGMSGERDITVGTEAQGAVAGLDGAMRLLRSGEDDLVLTGAAAPGAGAAAVLVKRLGDALASHDHVWALLRGAATDGAPVGFDGPVTAQSRALIAAGVRPQEVSYAEVDRHADLAALAAGYARPSSAGRCGAGTLDADLGVLTGFAQLIKTAMALEREQLPASAGQVAPLPAPLHAQDCVAPWPRDPQRPRVAAVHSGGGAAVLAEPPALPYEMHSGEPRVVVWSARTPAAERAARGRLARYFVWRGDEVFADAVATLQHARTAHPVRAAAVCTGALDAAAALSEPDGGRVLTTSQLVQDALRPITLVFPGRCRAAATHELHRDVPVFARALDGWLARLGSPGADDPARLFAVEAALAHVWSEAGIRPAALCGDGVGALVAAMMAGVFTPAGAATLVRAVAHEDGHDRAAHLERAFAGVTAATPAVPLLRADTAQPVAPGEVGDPAFWVRQVTAPPPADGTAPPGQRLEVGAGSTAELLTTAARLWAEGHDIEWRAIGGRPLRRRVPMPGYPPESLGADGYPLQLAAAIPRRRADGRATTIGLTHLTAPGAGPLVLAMPYAGASGRAFQGVRTYLPPECGLALIDLPGHGMRMGEQCLRHVDDVIDGLLLTLPALPTRRLILLGYSLGGSFSYELAARLTEVGRPPEGVVVCASRSPQTGVGHPPVAHWPAGQPFLRAAVAMGLAAPEMLELDELAESFSAPLQADLEMVETFPYRPRRPPLPVPASVIGLSGDWVVPEPSLRAWDELFADRPLHLRVNGGHLALHEREREFGTAVAGAVGHLLRLNRSEYDGPVRTAAP